MVRWMTLEQKRKIVEQKRERPAMSQEQLVEWAVATFKLKKAPQQTTISKILRQDLSAEPDSKKRRKKLMITCPRLESELAEWVQEQKRRKIPLCRALITAQARCIQCALSDDDASSLLLSNGWLTTVAS